MRGGACREKGRQGEERERKWKTIVKRKRKGKQKKRR